MVRAGEEYTVQGVKVRIMEVIPYRSYTGRRMLMIAYKIIDRGFESPTAHFWMPEREDIRPHLREIVAHYLEVRSALLGR